MFSDIFSSVVAGIVLLIVPNLPAWVRKALRSHRKKRKSKW
jgi:hypothetical protein